MGWRFLRERHSLLLLFASVFGLNEGNGTHTTLLPSGSSPPSPQGGWAAVQQLPARARPVSGVAVALDPTSGNSPASWMLPPCGLATPVWRQGALEQVVALEQARLYAFRAPGQHYLVRDEPAAALLQVPCCRSPPA